MVVSEKKTRTLITLTKEDKVKLELMAKNQNRSFSNLIETVLIEYLKKERP